MKSTAKNVVLMIMLALGVVTAFAAPEGEKEVKTPAFTFKDVEYFHRWTKDDQHEFTPRDQEDLSKWSDMLTLHRYPIFVDGDGLATAANAVLENYKIHRAMVLKTDSVPRTADKPAEHLIVVLFPRPEFIEAVFARFRLVDGVATATIYSHRVYGTRIGDQMSEWLKTNGPAVEEALMSWTAFPLPVPGKPSGGTPAAP